MKEISLGDDKAAPLFPVALASRGPGLWCQGGLAQLTNQMTDSAGQPFHARILGLSRPSMGHVYERLSTVLYL